MRCLVNMDTLSGYLGTARVNTFQLIKTVLDESYQAIPGTEPEKDAAIQEGLTRLRSEYRNLVNNGSLDYSDPVRRFAYIYCYTTSHANLVYSRISSNTQLQRLFDREKLTVSCIGGGPGSDFLGILKYCLRAQKSLELKCQILDRDPAWSESWSDVDDKINALFRISTAYQPIDVTDPTSWQAFRKHFHADFLTLIYFLSEVYALRDQASVYFKALLNGMRPGAVLLYVDNNDSRFSGWFDGMVGAAGLEVRVSAATNETLPLHEDKSDLQPYFNKFSSPKIKSDIAYRVVQKPIQ